MEEKSMGHTVMMEQLGFQLIEGRRCWINGLVVLNEEAARWIYNRLPMSDSIIDARIDKSIQEYADYLINDQCKRLLMMRDQDIAKVLDVSRPTVAQLRSSPSELTAGKMAVLEHHLSAVKAMILTTEEDTHGTK